MPRPLQYPARVNLSLSQETYDAYAEIAKVLHSTVPELIRGMADQGVPWLQKVAAAVRESPQDPNVAARLLLSHIGGAQLELQELSDEISGELTREELKKRKPA